MAWFNRRKRQPIPSSAPSVQAPTAAYYAPDQVRISHLDFDRPGSVTQGPRVHRIDVGNLVGASVFESAVCSSVHVDALVFSELAESMQVIERKFHGGQYDAQAMPLVEAFLSELHALAQIQVERNGIIDRRIADLRHANIMAYQAVCEERSRREEGIDKACMYEWHSMAASYERREARMRLRWAKKLRRDEERAEKAEAKAALTAKSAASKTLHREQLERRREERADAWRKCKQQRYERRLRKERLRAERESLKWQIRQERFRVDLDKLRGEKEAVRNESAARQAALEANVETARAQEQVARAQEEWARQELERLGAAETPACDALSAEASTVEVSVREVEAEVQEAAPEAVPEVEMQGATAEAVQDGVEPSAADACAVSEGVKTSELFSVTEGVAEVGVLSRADEPEPMVQELEFQEVSEASGNFDDRSDADKQAGSLNDALKEWVAYLSSDKRDK